MTQVQYRAFWGGRQQQPDPNAFDPTKDYYKVLEVKPTASESEIKSMYYKKCYEYHPDRSGGMHQDKFKSINVAYDILKN